MNKILIVDDEEKIREVLKIHLSKKKFKILEAQNGEEGIEKLKEDEFAVAICDIKMPKMDGLEFLEYTRKNHKLLPVIMLTGYVELDTAVTVMKKGAYDYLTKPIKKDDLYIAVDKAIEYRELLKEKEELRLANIEYQKDLEKKVKERTEELEKKNKILREQQKKLEESYRNLKQAQNDLIRSERLAVVGEMAAEIGHELNNYLSVLAGRTQILPKVAEKQDTEKLLQYCDIIIEQVHKMNRFTKGLMDSSARETKKKINNINETIIKIIEFIKPQNKYDFIKFELDLDNNIPEFQFDSEQFQQIFMNL